MARNNYFNNQEIQDAIVEYQRRIAVDGVDDVTIMHPYTDQIQQLIRAVINTHKIYKFWYDTNELVQEAMVEVYRSFHRFNHEKGTAFNYLSITVKNHLKNWTKVRNKKGWITGEYDDTVYQDEESIRNSTALEDVFWGIDIEPDLENILVDILEIIKTYKISNKKDIVKYLMTKHYYEKAKIDAVFKKLETYYKP